jgi:hypothetical protein
MLVTMRSIPPAALRGSDLEAEPAFLAPLDPQPPIEHEPPPAAGGRHFEAMALFAAGLGGAIALVLHARGHSREAFALGAAGAILGGSIAAIRVLSER